MIPDNCGATSVRALTALVLVPLTLALIWIPPLHPVFVLFVALLGGVGLHEFYEMVRAKGLTPEKAGGVMCGVAVVLSAYFADPVWLQIVLFAAFAVLAWVHLQRKNHSLPGMAMTVFGVLYVGWLSAFFVLLHRVPGYGPGLVTLLIIAVALSDTGAYFTGRALGKHKLAPKVSPNKTVEGAIGGVAWAVLGLAAVYFARQFGADEAFPAWSLLRYALLGALLSVLGQMGDLAESMMKRDAGVKDSGTIFPGHGGVLDRCDGFLFTAPLLYFSLMI